MLPNLLGCEFSSRFYTCYFKYISPWKSTFPPDRLQTRALRRSEWKHHALWQDQWFSKETRRYNPIFKSFVTIFETGQHICFDFFGANHPQPETGRTNGCKFRKSGEKNLTSFTILTLLSWVLTLRILRCQMIFLSSHKLFHYLYVKNCVYFKCTSIIFILKQF